ncbi:gamma-parvin [Tachyglossus aculeatus]|uniref:gamma-parvin n=1 Tax=Tachyglossus aculeatus TaxID=9261 RepID=UPI0018F2D796|nr:gamma-parvin [Tachyglossus aculeatus]
MDINPLYFLAQPPAGGQPTASAGGELSQGEKRKYLQPDSRKDPKLEELQKVLVDWINSALRPEHIVVRSLEEDLFDGLVLHHLLQRLGGIKLDVEEIALTTDNQRRKLATVLDAVSRCLPEAERASKWSVEAIFGKDLLATLHLLVALACHFCPQLALPSGVRVEVLLVERARSGLKSEKVVEQITACREDAGKASSIDVFEELLKHAPDKVQHVKEVIVQFINQKMQNLGLAVSDLETQFADGVILLLLIGQLEGFFLNLKDFFLKPSNSEEMVHNVTLALQLMKELGLLDFPIQPTDVVSGDTNSTLRVLYCLFAKHRLSLDNDEGLGKDGGPSRAGS